ncbi:ribonuclease J [Desulfobaculum xiamenense]|uniref:Ribonuclease J n=1 Tax=Desulfobaculum xiamenense TaxID=995050 RepID=A0A846QT58_9BACT|nr:ribonuclease J [Desulfobaculum xiamenense]NJB67829.1 ribonuclease J [Desulfobaculum xiamenense]
MAEKNVTLTPLGGLGEIGMNCMVMETEDSMILIDCGLMFPEDYLFGIDVVIPRFDYVVENKKRLKGILLTHGHEDHIGALPWLLQHVDAPVYGSEFTLGLVQGKLREHDQLDTTTLCKVEGHDRIVLGDFAVTFFPVCHSIVGGFGMGIETPAGRIVHTGDFKIDRYPLHGVATDLDGFKHFAEDGEVALMLSDSTNVERDGFALTEREIKNSLHDIFSRHDGRIIVTLFSSHIQRMQEVFDLAAQFGRKVAVNGRSLVRNIELARELGYLRVKDSTFIAMEDLPSLPDSEVVLLVTGSQGEPLASLSRIASGEHRELSIHEGDLVLMSSRFIPGNVRAITKVIDNLYRLGAEVLYESVQAIHASGHAHREELKIMLETVQPKFFVPVHGEYRHLVKHARLARECGVAPERAMVLENGDPLTLLADGGIRLEERVPVDQILVDGKGVGDVGQTVLKERQLLGGEGMVIVTLVVDVETGEILVGPDISSKGFVFEQQYSHLLEDAKCIVLDIFENVQPGDTSKLKERIRSSLRRFFRRVIDRDPVVVPLVMQI